MFCSECGEKRKSGKYCSNCGQKFSEESKEESKTNLDSLSAVDNRSKETGDANSISASSNEKRGWIIWFISAGILAAVILVAAILSSNNTSNEAAERETQRQARTEASLEAAEKAKEEWENQQQKLPDTNACNAVNDYLKSISVTDQQNNQQAANTLNQISIEIRNKVADAIQVRSYGVALADYFALAASYREAGLGLDPSFQGGLRQSLLNFESACKLYK